jgi:hypothetical protein
MGTRHLSMAYNKGGEVKVAQYGQWDGYPEGQGQEILKFLRSCDLKKLEKEIETTKFLTSSAIKKLWKECGANGSDFVSGDVSDKFREKHPALSRDTGSEVFSLIYNGIKELQDNSDFVNDSLFCEYCYVIDFKKRTFEIYNGFNKKPLVRTERFYKPYTSDKYYPVKFVKSYSLDKLPTIKKFLTDLKNK